MTFLLNHLLNKFETKNGKYNHLKVRSDNALGQWMRMSSLLDMINNPRFSLETAIRRDPVINSCSQYPLEELQSMEKTISCHLQMSSLWPKSVLEKTGKKSVVMKTQVYYIFSFGHGNTSLLYL